MIKKLSTVIFLSLIGVFASLADAPRPAFASTTLLYQSLESDGVIAPASNAYPLIATFDPADAGFSAPVFFDTASGVWAGFSFRGVGSFCTTATSAYYEIASTTNATLSGGIVWASDVMTFTSDFTFQKATASVGTGSWLIPGHTYGLYLVSQCSGSQIEVQADGAGLIGYGYLSWDGDYGPTFDDLAGRTRIVSVNPTDQQTVASSTTFSLSASIYVNEAEYVNDMFLRFRYIRQQDLQAVVANQNVLYTTIDVPITHFGSSILYATTSIDRVGEYLYSVQIRQPSIINEVLSWFNLGNLYDPQLIRSSDTRFIVVERTTLDQYLFDMASTTTAILGDPGVFEDVASSCNPISGFDFIQCISGLLIPNQTQLGLAVNTLQTQVLQKAPVGYITRLITILNGSATTSLPLISYTFGTESPLAGETLDFNFNSTLASANTILTQDWVSNNSEDPQNIWTIFMPLWNILVYAVLIMMIVSEITGIYHHKKL